MYAPPPPRKVRSGELGDGGLRVETSRGDSIEVPWEAVCCIFAARLEPEQASEQRPEGAGADPLARRPDPRQKKRTEATDASAALSRTPSLILDLYLAGEMGPLRFETTGTNMRSLLGDEAGYSGDLNFTALLKRLATLAPHALHASASEALAKGRSALRGLPSREDLYLASRRACKEMEEKRNPLPAPPAPAPVEGRPAREVSMQWVELPPAFQLGPAAGHPGAGTPPAPPIAPARPRSQDLSPPASSPRARELSPPVGPAPSPRARNLSPPVQRLTVPTDEPRPFPAPPPFPVALQRPRPPTPPQPIEVRPGPPTPASLPLDMFSEMRAAERQSKVTRIVLIAVIAVVTAWAMWVGLVNAAP